MEILLVNLHSALNLGDDAIMYSTLQSLRAAFPTARITAAANDPATWHKHPELEVVSSLCTWIGDCRIGRFKHAYLRLPLTLIQLTLAAMLYRLFKLRWLPGSVQQQCTLSSYYSADLVLSCGGGNFYANRRLSPSYLGALIALAFAIALGKRTIMLPQSVGPIEGWLQQKLAQWTFSHVDRVMLREKLSLQYVQETLHTPRPPVLLPDLAFGLPPLSAGQTHSDSERPLQIGVTIIDHGGQNQRFSRQAKYEQALQTALERLCREKDGEIHIFVQCFGPSPDQDDRHAARRLASALKVHADRVTLHETFTDALLLRSAYQDMDMIIGTRMHTGILAWSAAVPTILIGYQPKALGTLEWMEQQEFYFGIDEVDGKKLYHLACQLLEKREAVSQRITSRYGELNAMLHNWIRYLEAKA